MKDIFNQLYKKKYSNIAIATFVGVSVKTIRSIRKQLRDGEIKGTKGRIILKRLHALRDNKKQKENKISYIY